MLRDARTVHQDVHAAQLADSCIHHGGDVDRNGDIRLQRYRSSSQFADLLGGALWVLDVEIARRNIAAEFSKTECNRFTESDSSAGDQCHAPAEIKQVSSCGLLDIHDSNL